MTATIQFIQESFDKFNALCFEGKLPPIPIKLTKARTFLGKVTYRGRRGLLGRLAGYKDYCLRISTSFDLAQNELEDVVIHEMIHYYIALNAIRDTSVHGEVFRSMKDDINRKFGRNIVIRHCGKAASVPAGEIREHWICVSLLKDGRWGVTCCAKARQLEIYRGLSRIREIKSMQWYCSMDPFFNRYPRSRKATIYKITRAELDEHLKDAVPLRCETDFSCHKPRSNS